MTTGELFGREREIDALAAALETGRGRGSVLLIVGEPGIGKSALLASVRAAAQAAGQAIFEAVGVEGEMHLPFGGVQQLLAPLIDGRRELPPVQRDAVETALGMSDGSRPDLFLIAEATFTLLARERLTHPVTVVVDDVQWLDPQSHQILAFVAHRAVAAGLCVLGAVRANHPGPFANAGFPELEIHGVDDAAAERILRVHADALAPGDLRRIRQEASGNPLALLELPRAWVEEPPVDDHAVPLSVRLEQAFAGRVSELPVATRDALLVAAVGSSSDANEILAALLAFGTLGPSRELFAPAAHAGLVIEDYSSVEFRHPLVRSGVLQRETLTRRHAAHRALAEVLTADTYRGAWHRAWSIVGPDDQVADDLAATVPDSLRRGAVMTAVASLQRAAQLTSSSTERGRRLLAAAEYAFGVGRADVVARILREVALVDVTDLDLARSRWLTEALNDDISANPAQVAELCDSARGAYASGDAGLSLKLVLAAALRCWWAENGISSRRKVLGVLDELKELRRDPRHVAAVAIAEPVLRASEVRKCLNSVDLSTIDDGESLRMYGMAAYGVGDFPLATDLLDRTEQLFREQGRLGLLPVVLALQLHIRLDLGDWAGAASASRKVNVVSIETGQALFAENNVLIEGRRMALRGEWEAALELIADAETEAVRLRVNDRICFGYQARGAALLGADRPGAAFACLKRQYDPADPGYHLRESFAGVALMAEAAVDCGRVDEARAITGVLETVAIVTPSPLLEVNLLYARAVLAPEETRESCYRAALEYDLVRWPWIRARIDLEYGRWLQGVDRHAEAAAHLEAAREVFDRIGARRWSRRVAGALAGEAGRDPGPGPGSGLEP